MQRRARLGGLILVLACGCGEPPDEEAGGKPPEACPPAGCASSAGGGSPSTSGSGGGGALDAGSANAGGAPHTGGANAGGASAAGAPSAGGAANTGGAPNTGGASAAKAIDPADILHQAQAEVPFAQHKGYSGQLLGTYPACTSIPEYPSGIFGSKLANGETLRMGKVDDPEVSGRKAFAFQLAPTDPNTSGSKRCEFSFKPNVALEKTYWVAFSVYVYDWGALGDKDKSLFGTQLHSGDNSLGLSPSLSVNTAGTNNRRFEVQGRYQTNLGSTPSQSNTTTVRSEQRDIPFETWMDVVIKFKQDPSGGGVLAAYIDGELFWTYQGKLGFDTPGYQDYIKFGYYNWSGSNFTSSRKILLRSPMLVSDPTGSKYTAADLRVHVQQH